MRKTVMAGAAAIALALMPSNSVVAQNNVISAADKAEGAKAHPDLLAEFGGAMTGKQADYVRGVGQRIALATGISNAKGDFTITLLNSSVNNAFAIPGGYVYVTRELMALMNNEAELASVMGHEEGHVYAQHARKRNAAATRNGVIGILGQVLSGVLLGNTAAGQLLGQTFAQGAQMLTLKYSRSQEYEADDLGVQFLARAGYDPMASSTMLASLAAQTALDARIANRDARAMPEWASTHPDPASRVTRAAQNARKLNVRGETNRDAFLNALNGGMYGDDPHQGVVEGQQFLHPDLKLAFTIPDGYAMSNGTQAVSISGNGGQAQFSGGRYNGDIRNYVGQVFAALASDGQQGSAAVDTSNIQTTRIAGFDGAMATRRANTQSGQVDVTVVAYIFDPNTAYHFVTITPAGQGAGPFTSMFNSMRRLTTAQAAQVRPRHIQVLTVGKNDTVASLSAKMAYSDYRTERFLTLNALASNARLVPGQRVKIVVYG